MVKIKFVYFDYGGSHSSVIAAHIHAGNLKGSRMPSSSELMELPFFDKTTPDNLGRLYLVGRDEKGNEIYILGSQNSNFEPVLRSLAALLELDKDFVFVCTMPYVNPLLRLGGFLSRRLSLPLVGRPLVILGAKWAFPHLRHLVEKVKIQTL
ncbi:Protein of unknown function [Thermosyntropha lipolytica DSM 11003]|uniref:DUF3189 family protein n=1 Tax=Thermosyntropha lipolytica DSM 11003 TaxID=1123382 RepID=A0A1M5PRC8_9FIRM|nr:DUF3189 family protein [Thermosyntropha lipolytica]SHH04328.1 Protein of unknown function [Thermosyntropha lipolytica DSM 11003]